MNHPFKIIRGGQAEAEPPPPTKFAKFDNKKAIGDRFMKSFFAKRDKAIDRMRAKLNEK